MFFKKVESKPSEENVSHSDSSDSNNNKSLHVNEEMSETLSSSPYLKQKLEHQWLDLLKSGDRSDFTIKCSDGKTVKCHSLVLYVRCPLALSHAAQEMDKSYVLPMVNYTKDTIETVLRYVYGDVEENVTDKSLELMTEWGLYLPSDRAPSEKRKSNPEFSEAIQKRFCHDNPVDSKKVSSLSTIPESDKNLNYEMKDEWKTVFGDVVNTSHGLSNEEQVTILPHLTEAICKEIEAVTQTHEDKILKDAYKIQLKGRDIKSLVAREFLTDEIINFYLSMIASRSCEEPNMRRIYNFNTFFYYCLASGGFKRVQRWTKLVDIFSYNLVYIPIHINRKKYLHWSLVVVDMDEKSIIYLDSGSGEDHKDVLINVAKYLVDEHRAKKESEAGQSLFGNIKIDNISLLFNIKFSKILGWKLINAVNVPKQQNGWDCGAYICEFAEYVSRGEPFHFDDTLMPYFRRKIIFEITKNRFL